MRRGLERRLDLAMSGAAHLWNHVAHGARLSIDFDRHPLFRCYWTHPPIRYSWRPVASLVHRLNRVSGIGGRPFVVEFEHPLIATQESLDYVEMLRRVPDLAAAFRAPACRGIIAPSPGAARETARYLPDPEILAKIRVSRPAIPAEPASAPHDGPFRLFHIASKFWGKGTAIALDVFANLRARHGAAVEFDLVTNDLPSGWPLPDGVRLIAVDRMAPKQRRALYDRADLFLLPLLQDSCGVFLECLAHGLPVLSTRIYDKDDMVEHGASGWLVETPLSLWDGAFGHDWTDWADFNARAARMYAAGAFAPMADEMLELTDAMVRDRAARARLARGARDLHARRFTPEIRNAGLLTLYGECFPEWRAR
ncbi:MAG: glycosyltransferase [Alphaproteobacteria bacterium]|nr:glycosyltransferase [Alphaproteobacteria bacterium]